MTDCPFCKKIEKGGDEHGLVYDTKLYNVKRFVPLNPVTSGHMLFVPVAHFVKADKGNLATADAFDAAIRYARSEGIEDYNLIQSNGVHATQTVPHVHVHLVPRVDGDDLALPWDNNAKTQQELEAYRGALTTLKDLLARGELSDEYHTFNDLYEARMLYHAHAIVTWQESGIRVFKSEYHSNGELCFGGGWFIVVAELPGGQVSQHYRLEHWDLFDCLPVTEPPEFDGHTTQDVHKRLRDALGIEES